MPSNRRFLAVVGAGSLALAGLSAGPVLASTGSSAGLRGASSSNRLFSGTNSKSPQIAGWVFNKPASTASTVTFKAPKLKCVAATQAVAPGIDVFTGTTTSPKFQSAALFAACSGGAPLYIQALTVNGAETNTTKPVNAGDTMTSTVLVSPTKVFVILKDLTAPRKFTLSKTANSPGPSLQEQFVTGPVFLGGALLPVPNFGIISYTGGSINKTALGAVKPAGFAIDRVKGTTLQIQTTALLGAKKDGFNTVFKHS